MPQIEIPFTPGQRVRTKDGKEWTVQGMKLLGDGTWRVYCDSSNIFPASDLTLVEPVIEWKLLGSGIGWDGYVNGEWEWVAYDNGLLWYGARRVGTFPDPRAVAEATQTRWNEARKHD